MQNSGTLSMVYLGGERISGVDLRTQNTSAVMTIANILRSSLGPNGLDKMIVDDIGDMNVTSDGATIVKLLEIQHPTAKVLVDLAINQDREVGDGTTSVILIASELIKQGNDMIKQKIHPTTVINGYRLACREGCKFIDKYLSTRVDTLPMETIMNCAKTALSSKILVLHEDFFAKIAADAVMMTKMGVSPNFKYSVKSVNIIKGHGKSMKDSMLVHGYVLNGSIASQEMPQVVNGAKIACLNIDLSREKLHLGIQIVVDDVEKIEDIRNKEIQIAIERAKMIVGSGANVVLTSKGIDDVCVRYFLENSVMAIKRVKKSDLRRIAKTTGATVLDTFANIDGDESFETMSLGHADKVELVNYADDECILFRGTKMSNCASIILRGPNEATLDEMDRALRDALCAVKRSLESQAVVPGGGAVEAALYTYIDNFSRTIGSKEQVPVAAFANSLLTIPRALATNAGKNALDLVSKLQAYHHKSQTQTPDSNDFRFTGLDLSNGTVRNNLKAGVLEPVVSKIKSLRAATEAAMSILRLDDLIRIFPEKQSDNPGQDCE